MLSMKVLDRMELMPNNKLAAVFVSGIRIRCKRKVMEALEKLPIITYEIHLLKNCGHVVTNSIEYIIPFLMKNGVN